MKDYYQILEVPETASADEIKKSYRKMSKQYHPDVNPNGADKFKEISEAYEILSDTDKRNSYDQKRKNPFGFSGDANGMDLNDLINNLFGQSRQRRPSAPEKVINISVGVIDSFLGINKPITYLRNIACNSCNGNGGEAIIKNSPIFQLLLLSLVSLSTKINPANSLFILIKKGQRFSSSK